FKSQGANQLWPCGPAVLGLGWALVVDRTPETLEELLAHQPGDDPPDEAEGQEEELSHRTDPSALGSRLVAILSAPQQPPEKSASHKGGPGRDNDRVLFGHASCPLGPFAGGIGRGLLRLPGQFSALRGGRLPGRGHLVLHSALRLGGLVLGLTLDVGPLCQRGDGVAKILAGLFDLLPDLIAPALAA